MKTKTNMRNIRKLAGALRASEIMAMTEGTNTFRRDRDGLIRCRVCGCTEREACNPPCSWIEVDLCSGCANAKETLLEWHEGARRANMAALLRELKLRADARRGRR